MQFIRPDVYKAVKENNLGDVVFQDPFSEGTRKSKRNLVAGGFACLMISILKLQITSFSGLQAVNGSIGNELAKGLSCVIVMYLLISFAFQAFVDYSAWKFEHERKLVQPYLELISMLESHIQVTSEQVRNAVSPLNQIIDQKTDIRSINIPKVINGTRQQLDSINQGILNLSIEVSPLLESWRNTVTSMQRLNPRFRVRVVSLWALDIVFPILLSCIAIWQSGTGLIYLYHQIWA